MPNPAVPVEPEIPSNLSVINTDNLDLANLLHAIDCKCLRIQRNHNTPPKAVWFFDDTELSREAAILWLQCNKPESNRTWSSFSKNEKEAAIHLMASFCNERKATLKQAKEAMSL